MAAPHVTVLNGPNLNLLGEREPHIYGATTLAEVDAAAIARGKALGLDVTCHQSNHEGVLVDLIHAARKTSAAIVINPAGYSFFSIPLLDALKTFDDPIVELHISNIHARDENHRHSKISGAATAVICGLGPYGYIAAIEAAAHLIAAVKGPLPTGTGTPGAKTA